MADERIAPRRPTILIIMDGVAVWIHPDNYEKLGIGLPRPLIEVLQSRNLFLMSVFVGKQPIGVVLTDADDEPLTERDYATFKQLTMLASKRLTQLREIQSPGKG